VRLQGLLALGQKSKQLASLLGAEREKRAALAELDRQASEVKEIVATRDARQVELDSIDATLERHRLAMAAEAKRITDEAHSAAQGIVDAAHRSAETILATARATAAAEAQEIAEREAQASRERQAEISRLDADIAAKRAEHETISSALAEVRAKLGIG
jgi:ribonuclease Y